MQQELITKVNCQLEAIAKWGFITRHDPVNNGDYRKGTNYKGYRIWVTTIVGEVISIAIMSSFTRYWFSFSWSVEEVEPHLYDIGVSWAKEVIDHAIEESEFAKSMIDTPRPKGLGFLG
jgi:hypothetical protein